MKKLMFKSVTVVAFAAALAIAMPAMAGTPTTAPGKNKLVCFSGGGGVCTLDSNGAKGPATLDTSAGGWAGVYYIGYNNSIYGVLLSEVTQLSFTYTGTDSITDPRFSVPIDTDNDGLTDFWAYIPASTGNNGSGLVDVINDATCTIYVSYDALLSYPNWAAFAAANPTATVALQDNYVFVIADSSLGVWTVSNVTIGKPGK